jgi:hypothetical protein
MPTEVRPRPQCFLALPFSTTQSVRRAIARGVEDANFRVVGLDRRPSAAVSIWQAVVGEVARADCVVADLTGSSPNVFFEIGLAQAMGKGVFPLRGRGTTEVPPDLSGLEYFEYEINAAGLTALTKRLSASLREYRHSARRAPIIPGSRLPLPQSLDTSKHYTLIQFKDNGPGVPLENKVRIFDAFFTTRHHGTGLGLALVRRIIEGHGGIILESGRPGDGANFEIYLPDSGETLQTSA